jgi:chromatin structure-remodeling complex subunit RSC1/2
MTGTPVAAPLPSPHANQNPSQTPYGQQFGPSRPSASPAPLVQQLSYNSHGSAPPIAPTQTPHYQPQNNYTQYAPSPTPVVQHMNPLANYSNYQSHTVPRPVAPVSTSHHSHGNASNAYNPPRPVEVYTLAQAGNSAIPMDIRAQFHHDEYGNILFYTTPPLDARPVAEGTANLGHSLRYLADKARSRAADEKKRKAREIELEAAANEKLKRLRTNEKGEKDWLIDDKLESLRSWGADMEKATDELYQELHGENWKEIRQQDLLRLAIRQEQTFNKEKENSEFRKKRAAEREVKIRGFRWI